MIRTAKPDLNLVYVDCSSACFLGQKESTRNLQNGIRREDISYILKRNGSETTEVFPALRSDSKRQFSAKILILVPNFCFSSRLIGIALTGFKSLPPLFEKTPNAVHELTLARDIYEHAVILSVKIEDQDAFERDFCQLKPYYTDAASRLPPSPQEYPILGLNLLTPCAKQNSRFHTELELLSAIALENPCIKHAVELEQSFMEGAYNRVLTARQAVPHETYVYFMDLLAKTVRDEIAGCSEKAYDTLSVNDARQMLLYSSDKEVIEYIKEVKSVASCYLLLHYS
ncbi:hypothetical protein SASPL_131324 [Salvia splendens]|uniref:PCI domain-containing protein n=1 Tax=Salvia splendens TaxID=180675 RepID=A0A8X8X8V7_SALSN|nr:hypothetical protein SASPL_131324 [Salvia splendens]